MKLLALGGDRRYAYLAAVALRRGLDAQAFGLEDAGVPGVRQAERALLAHVDTVVLPNPFERGLQMPYATRELTLAELAIELPAGSTMAVFGSGKAPESLAKRFRIVELCDEPLLRQLAWQTAEGAIHEVQTRVARMLRGSSVMVIGYGRIGQALTDILMGYGARVLVVARHDAARRLARAAGADTADFSSLSERLPGQSIVFSTPPARVLDRPLLSVLPHQALLVDLSSAPYGVDMIAAKELGLTAWRSPGLPGRHCPESAGEALLDSLMTMLKEEGSL